MDSGVEMTTETGSGQGPRPAPGTVAPAGVSEPAWLARLDRLEGRQRGMIVLGVELAALTRFLASRRFVATVIVAVVVPVCVALPPNVALVPVPVGVTVLVPAVVAV